MFALLAVLLNLGSPMAWAQTAASDPADCHGHEMAAMGDTAAAPDSMPCCDDGECSCAAPALSIAVALVPARPGNPPFIGLADTSALPEHPLDDSLRPPIR